MGKRTGILNVVLGTTIAVYAFWYIVRGPLFGWPIPPLEHLLAVTGVFIVGVVILGVGTSWYVAAVTETEEDRVVPPDGHV